MTTTTPRVEEGNIEVPGGKVWYKSVGEGDLPPLLVTHGGPGFTHNYLTPLEDLADRRRVIFWDQLGCGKSETPHDASLWTMDRSLREVDAVREHLGLTRHHLFGNSWGGMLVQQYVLDRQPDLVSLTVSNSLASMPRLGDDTARLKRLLPQSVQDTIDYHEDNELYACPEYQGAIAIWYQTYICRMQPWPMGLEESFAGVGMEIYMAMIGPSDFKVTGNLKEWDIMDRLHEITIPTLFVAGRYDECTPEHMELMHDRVPGSEYALFENSAHMPFYEEREACMNTINNFMSRAEAET
ncbi:MAG: proline iminopeptidase-family hydrolase [Candidatus Dormibacteraeota bacterium]|uniref:Proline iminopeptidase n=1 Tax=Candidatus Aeolococcus gillhamiae TaxID=3127015 RepID=A0A934JYQ2_9BACT|nr:proline iminopeptidase-family hydrolase [Candidatus Dormibacteraeota bacterium]